MSAISQTTFSNAFSWIKMFKISLEIRLNISLEFVIKIRINNI